MPLVSEYGWGSRKRHKVPRTLFNMMPIFRAVPGSRILGAILGAILIGIVTVVPLSLISDQLSFYSDWGAVHGSVFLSSAQASNSVSRNKASFLVGDEHGSNALSTLATKRTETLSKPVQVSSIKIWEPHDGPVPETRFNTTKVQRGDSLSRIFKREGIPQRDLALLLKSEPFGPELERIHAGRQISYRLDDQGRLWFFEYTPNTRTAYHFIRKGDNFQSDAKSIELVTKIAYASGTIQQGGYLIRAATRAGVKDEATVLELAHIFRWNIDFFHEVRSGDNFKLLYEEEYLKNAYHGDGNILIAEYTNRQGANLAIRYEHSDGSARYYDLEGNALMRAFLRAPLEFVRISSPFNPRRFHPIHKQIMPHRGIDYAAPIGTPVHATGDGIVQEAGYTRANGYYVVINHKMEFQAKYQTKYLHLKKIGHGITRNTQVMQGQRIGIVGMSGYATGPHLHYEFLVDGTHRNPSTVSLPLAPPLKGKNLEAYLSSASKRLEEFDRHQQRTANLPNTLMPAN